MKTVFALVMAIFLFAAPVNAHKRVKVVLPPTRVLTFGAIVDAANAYGLPLAPFIGILATEGGKIGEAWSNKNGTWDLGPFQVNTCHLNDLSEIGFTPEAIMTDGTANAHAAAWILRREIDLAGNLWQGVGHYHSRTPFRKYGYIRKVRENMKQLQRNGVKCLPIHWEKKL